MSKPSTQTEKTLPDELNPAFLFQGTLTALLVEIAAGRLDAKELARWELSSRGLGQDGTWVGFPKAEAQAVEASRRDANKKAVRRAANPIGG